MAGAQRRSRVSSTDADDMPNSAPAKWPGNFFFLSQPA